MSQPPTGLKFAWYGDDFTGATDTLATAAQAGLRSLLFLGVPRAERLSQAGPLDGFGIAGAARSMTPEQMQAELEPVGCFFAGLNVPVMHYKICSTFDSAPHIGNAGWAIKTLKKYAINRFVPVVGGQPSLGRYCVFGNLFAAAGNGGVVHRLDRHPTMSRHPVTPMHEADLRLHLAQQGLPQLPGIDYTAYDDPESLEAQLDILLEGNPDAVLLDVAHSRHLVTVGRLIWQRALLQRLLTVGPSSVVQALAAHWQRDGHLQPARPSSAVAPAQGPVLVLAGSLSPLTAQQIQAASSYAQIELDPALLTLADPAYRQQTVARVAALLKHGQSVLASTSFAARRVTNTSDSQPLAQVCGNWLAQVLHVAPVRRLGIAGGDTSSHAVGALNAWGLSYLQPLAPGVALCRLHSDSRHLDGMEIMLKGGQMGSSRLFEQLLHGT